MSKGISYQCFGAATEKALSPCQLKQGPYETKVLKLQKNRQQKSATCFATLERLRFTFTPNGKREFVPRDQVFPLIVINCLLLQLKNK